MQNNYSTWWSKKNMMPVKLYSLKADYFKSTLLILASIIILSGLIYCIYQGITSWITMTEIKKNVYSPLRAKYGLPYSDKLQVLVYVYIAIVIALLWIGNKLLKYIKKVFETEVFVDKYRRSKNELLDTDFIQQYDSRDEHFVFFGRGTEEEHKFGLFDVKEISIKLKPVYDDIQWHQKGYLLKVLKKGEWNIIDLQGNIYK